MENEAKIERIKTLMENFGVTQSEFAQTAYRSMRPTSRNT